jgi:hypothetical protein
MIIRRASIDIELLRMRVEQLRMDNFSEPAKTLPNYAFEEPFAVYQSITLAPIGQKTSMWYATSAREAKKRRPAKGGGSKVTTLRYCVGKTTPVPVGK